MTPTRLALDMPPTCDDDGNMLAVIEAGFFVFCRGAEGVEFERGKRRAAQLVEQARRVFARG